MIMSRWRSICEYNVFCTSTLCCQKVPVVLNMIMIYNQIDTKFEATYSKFTKSIELLSTSIIDNHTKMQDVLTLTAKVNDLCSSNSNLQEELDKLKAQASHRSR